MVAQEDPEFTFFHRHSKSTSTCRAIPVEKELTEQLLHKKNYGGTTYTTAGEMEIQTVTTGNHTQCNALW